MKISILFSFIDQSWGGGNQFLVALKNHWQANGIYEKNPEKADAVIINSYHKLQLAIKLKIQHPNKKIIHRLGPVFFLHRGYVWKIIDKLIIEVATAIADLIVFQSCWSRDRAMSLFSPVMRKNNVIIKNAVDDKIFYPANSSYQQKKIKLIANSWSTNANKGFDIYKYLDDNLNFNKYSMTFIGRSPIKFKNIIHIQPLSSIQLADQLRRHDIFIAAFKHDACSNSILEAQGCGLPVIAINSGANKEIVSSGLFLNNREEILDKIDLMSENLDQFKKRIKVVSLTEIADQYFCAIKKNKEQSASVQPSFFQQVKLVVLYCKFTFFITILKIYQKLC